MRAASILWLIFGAIFTGCTTVPERFKQDESIYPNCGYRAESMGTEGFALEIFYKAYAFFPIADPAVQEARECFRRTAATLAKRAGKTIKPLYAPDMNASPTRNIVDANYSVYVTGRVYFIQGQ